MSPTHDAGPPTRSYRPGDWFGIVGERVVVLLPPTEKHRVAALWELADGGAGFDVTLDALIAGGLRELPGFVLVSTVDGQTQVVLRGAARAELRAGGESVTLAGSQATTWVERTLVDVEQMSLVVGSAAPGPTGVHGEDDGAGQGPAYVVDGGLFRMSQLDETPAHQGPHEAAVEPAYERELPLSLAVDEAASEATGAGLGADLGPDTEPDPEPDPGPDPGPDPLLDPLPDPLPDPSSRSVAEPTPAPPRSPVPPSWIPGANAPLPVPPVIPPPVVPPPIPPVVPADEVDDPADHDGLTVTGSWQPAAPVPPGIPGQPPAPDVTRPVARLELPGGEVVDVDRAIVFGRAPAARRFSPTEEPRLVTVHSPNLEVSSTHLEVRPGSGADHGSAVATDLGSTNGTVLVQAGLPPQDLVAGQTVQLFPGAVLDLGDGVLIRISQPAR